MVFSSIPFLLIFFPLVILINSILPLKYRNLFLLFANLIFYAYGEPVYVLLMIASILLNFTGGYFVERLNTAKGKKIALVLTIILNILALGYFKYTNMIVDLIRKIPSFSAFEFYDVILPIGISFYTFQAMSYVIDVYRGDCKAEKNLIDFSAYISLFPQLIAGPIVRYKDVAGQLGNRNTSVFSCREGIELFLIGLSKKVLLANPLGTLWEKVSLVPEEYGIIGLWLGALAYTFQIYFDFSGYSDMARGLGKMLGFDFCINFNYPYISKSITEFWRRWHISLGTWFRDYVYIPLGGNRVNKGRFILNIIIVWALTGLWHGAGLTFVFWGLYYGVILLLEKLVWGKILNKIPSFLARIYTLFFVIIGWLFFASESFNKALNYIKYMFSLKNGLFGEHFEIVGWVLLIVISAICSTPCFKNLYSKIKNNNFAFALEIIFVIASLILCISGLVSESYNPFLYFRF